MKMVIPYLIRRIPPTCLKWMSKTTKKPRRFCSRDLEQTDPKSVTFCTTDVSVLTMLLF